MAKQRTNLFEIILRDSLIGRTIYDDSDVPMIITELNYDPLLRCAYISNGTRKKKILITDNFFFEYDIIEKVIPNEPTMKGSRDR